MRTLLSKTVLVVLDNQPTAPTMRTALESCGYTVHSAADAGAAQEVLASSGGVDAVLVGVHIDASRIVSTHDVPILFVISHPEHQEASAVDHVPFYGYVHAAASPPVLDSAIRNAVRLHEAATQAALTEATLRETNAYLESLFSSTAAPIIVWDTQCRIIRFNRAFEAMTGRSVGEVIGASIESLVPASDAPRLIAMVTATLNGTTWEDREITILNRSGETRILLCNSALIHGADGHTVIAGIAHGQDVTERMREQESRIEAERTFSALFEHGPVGALMWAPDGRLMQCNAQITAITGYEFADIATIELWFERAYPHPDYREHVRQAWAAAPQGGIETQEFWVTCKQGDRRAIEFRAVFMTDGRSIVTLVDVTERRRVQADLERQSAVQRLLVEISTTYINMPTEAIPDAVPRSLHALGSRIGADRVFIFDYKFEQGIAVNTYEWCAEGIVPQIAELSAVPLEAIGEGVSAHKAGLVYHIPDLDAMPPGAMRDVLERQGIRSMLTVPMMHGATCVGCVGFDFVRTKHSCAQWEQDLLTIFAQMVAGVEQRRRQEQALRESEYQYRTLVEVLSQGVFRQGADGRPVDVNSAALRMMGLSREVFMDGVAHGPDWDLLREDGSVLPPEAHPATVALRTGLPVHGVTLGVLNAATRGRVWMEVNAIPLFRADELEPYQAVVSLHDITARKRAEDLVKVLLREKELLVQEVHHRIKNNMATVVSLLSLQEGALPDGSAGAEALRAAMNRVRSMMVLYDKLYRSQNVREVAMQEYLPELAQEIVRQFPFAERIDLQCTVEDFVIPAGSASPLGIVVNELITNAMKHAFVGRDRGKIIVEAARTDSGVCVVVADDGVGPPPSFEVGAPRGVKHHVTTGGHSGPQGADAPEGRSVGVRRGFGKTLIAALARQLDAQVRVEDAGGTRVTITFPVTFPKA